MFDGEYNENINDKILENYRKYQRFLVTYLPEIIAYKVVIANGVNELIKILEHIKEKNYTLRQIENLGEVWTVDQTVDKKLNKPKDMEFGI